MSPVVVTAATCSTVAEPFFVVQLVSAEPAATVRPASVDAFTARHPLEFFERQNTTSTPLLVVPATCSTTSVPLPVVQAVIGPVTVQPVAAERSVAVVRGAVTGAAAALRVCPGTASSAIAEVSANAMASNAVT